MNFNQRNFNKKESAFSNQRRPEQEYCPHFDNFPPEINWDCEDDSPFKKNFYNKYIENSYNESDLRPCHDLYDEYFEYEDCDRKENNNTNDKCHKKNNYQNSRNCGHHQRRYNCCGFFRIFHC